MNIDDAIRVVVYSIHTMAVLQLLMHEYMNSQERKDRIEVESTFIFYILFENAA